ncbi:MAG TPA: LL-diaminopimelate aminotransferase [Methylomirabilota bacterium]|jgi:LL-diaminopimelate aminotransferase|nr:LL-diaminopimelate aminotransferase [Methylomirabilota bacterium]
MPRINESYLNLRAAYLFAEIRRRQKAFGDAHPEARVIDLGVGDVTRPLPPAVVRALHEAADDMARPETFKGYGPYVGYEWLRAEIAAQDFAPRGVTLAPDEVFVSDGGKSDSANLQEIFARECVVGVMDPVYPVYADANVVAGRTGAADESGRYAGMVYLPVVAENGFQPTLPDRRVDLIYLCYPNNPTGAVATREALARWVEYARAQEAVIFYDAAYEAYIADEDVPHSIYEIPGAREVAIECRSFSKNAGFTGLRMAYTVVPTEARGTSADGRAHSLNALWARRVNMKSNGPPYPIQKAAAAAYSPDGGKQVRALIEFYMANARVIRDGLAAAGFTVYGGRNAPYIWFKTPAGVGSWDFFDRLLADVQIVGAPGSGFGPSGEGYFRLTAFGSREQTEEAVERIRTRLHP